MYKTLKNITMTFVAIFVVVIYGMAQGEDLRINIQKGTSYTVSVKSNQQTTMKLMGQSVNSSQVLEYTQNITVQDVREGENEVSTSLKHVKMSQNQMGMSFSFDSDKPEDVNPMLAELMSEFMKMIDVPHVMVFDDKGNLLSADTSDNTTNLVSAQQVIIELPQEPITKGGSWTTKKDMSVSDLKMEASYKYIVQDMDKKKIVVEFAGEISGIDANGTCAGNITLNRNTCIVSQINMTQDISMTVEEQGLTIPVRMKSTTDIIVK